MKKILVIHGPNFKNLHLRTQAIYGGFTLQQLYQEINQYQAAEYTFFQSNHEGDIIDVLESATDYDAIIINAGAYSHTSIAIRDALEMCDLIKVNVHLSDVKNRDDFRKHDYLEDVVDQTFFGKQLKSYFEAIDYILKK